jgi:hypothetical protein
VKEVLYSDSPRGGYSSDNSTRESAGGKIIVYRKTSSAANVSCFSRPFHGLRRVFLSFPAMNRWAIVSRPLSRTGLGNYAKHHSKLPNLLAACFAF